MNRSVISYYTLLFGVVIVITLSFTYCTKNQDPIKFPQGTFPDTVINLSGINSVYDDYNSTITQLNGYMMLIFSSKRKSGGLQFDLEQAYLTFMFDKTTGEFLLGEYSTMDVFHDNLISKAQTPRDDLGPYRFYSARDGFEYMVIASKDVTGILDMFYLRNRPPYGNSIPQIEGPFPLKHLNTEYDEGYLCFDLNHDSAYFMTNKSGNFDIFLQKKPADVDVSTWFDSDYAPSTRVDSVNSAYDDKCPVILNNIMVFTSNRPGGLGGYDLYYSLFKKGKWSSPINLGAPINTEADEYRPILGYHSEFSNNFMIFSSNKPGGLGGFDLYFTGIKFLK